MAPRTCRALFDQADVAVTLTRDPDAHAATIAAGAHLLRRLADDRRAMYRTALTTNEQADADDRGALAAIALGARAEVSS